MSDAALDRGPYFPAPMTDWYGERPFKVAFAVSVVIHAVLLALIPGFRSIPIEMPRVMEVEIVPEAAPPISIVQEKPLVAPKTIQPTVVPISEPLMRQPQPELPPLPRTDIIRTPRAEPKPELVVPRPELRPELKDEPRVDTRPEPKIEPRPAPAPVARVDPPPEPPAEIRPEPQSPPRESPPVVQPRVEAVVTEPPPVATAPAAPVVVPPPQAVDESRDRTVIEQYQRLISARIKQYEEYPLVAKKRYWQGTTVVQLRLTPEGKVTDISVVGKSGHEILDEAAVRMIRKASPLPLPPEGLRGRDQTVLVPIKFRLDS